MSFPTFSASNVVFVNRFRSDAKQPEFEAAFNKSAEPLKGMPGFLWHVLLRCPDDDQYDYINVACWEAESDFWAAVTTEKFREHAGHLRDIASTEPAVCRAVAVGLPGNAS